MLRHVFDQRHECRVIEVAATSDSQRLEHLRHQCRHRQWDAELLASRRRDPEVLAVQVDPESWLEIVADHPGPLQLQNLVPGQPT